MTGTCHQRRRRPTSRLTLVDDTTQRLLQHHAVRTARHPRSAEIVAEAPTDASVGDLLPLADFGAVDFTGCAIDGRPLGAFARNQISMVAHDGATLAAASSLSSDGTSFAVSRVRRRRHGPHHHRHRRRRPLAQQAGHVDLDGHRRPGRQRRGPHRIQDRRRPLDHRDEPHGGGAGRPLSRRLARRALPLGRRRGQRRDPPGLHRRHRHLHTHPPRRARRDRHARAHRGPRLLGERVARRRGDRRRDHQGEGAQRPPGGHADAYGAVLNTPLVARFACRLAAGHYRFSIYATDAAGNVQSSVASNTLTVR